MLGLEIEEIDVMYYDTLKTCVLQHHLLVDSLIYKDVKLTATNDDQYFVFEDYLYQVHPSFPSLPPRHLPILHSSIKMSNE